MNNNHKPLFECKSCGYQDYMGNTSTCPICEPDKNAEENVCFFINLEDEKCRQDGKTCPYIKDKEWEACKKLEGFDPTRGRE